MCKVAAPSQDRHSAPDMVTPSSRFGRQGAFHSGNEVSKVLFVPMVSKSLVDRRMCSCVLPALSWEEGGNKVWRGGSDQGKLAWDAWSISAWCSRPKYGLTFFQKLLAGAIYYYRGAFDACLAPWKVDRVATAHARGHISKSQSSRGGTGWLPFEEAINYGR